MISDTLSDAAATIREYLATSDAYKDMPASTEKLIHDALEAMDAARIHLDAPPSDDADEMRPPTEDETLTLGPRAELRR
jgi:hypothetical protein